MQFLVWQLFTVASVHSTDFIVYEIDLFALRYNPEWHLREPEILCSLGLGARRRSLVYKRWNVVETRENFLNSPVQDALKFALHF
jgi:hypothetical protein